MFEFQTHLIFPTDAVPDPGPWPAGADRLSIQAADGEKLEGIHIPANDPHEPRTLVLGFGGNAWNGQDVAEYLHELFPDTDVVSFHYRGYRPSTGSPSADALIADAPLVFDAAKEQVKPVKTIAVGFSIGSGIAATLAVKRSVDALILVTPFDSLKAVAQAMYPWLPIAPFFQHEIDAAGAIRQARIPVAMIAAERDEIVPPERTQVLRVHVRDLVFDRTISRAGHNDIYSRSEFHDAMHEALAAVSG
jgi:pimeloyl-ACP methyl ester carboxylesterase